MPILDERNYDPYMLGRQALPLTAGSMGGLNPAGIREILTSEGYDVTSHEYKDLRQRVLTYIIAYMGEKNKQ